MNSHTHRIRMSAFALLLLSASFAAVAAPPSPTPTGKPWLDMDYGPFLTATVEAGEPAGNFAYKGIVIRIGPKEQSTIFGNEQKQQPVHHPQELAIVVLLIQRAIPKTFLQDSV